MLPFVTLDFIDESQWLKCHKLLITTFYSSTHLYICDGQLAPDLLNLVLVTSLICYLAFYIVKHIWTFLVGLWWALHSDFFLTIKIYILYQQLQYVFSNSINRFWKWLETSHLPVKTLSNQNVVFILIILIEVVLVIC